LTLEKEPKPIQNWRYYIYTRPCELSLSTFFVLFTYPSVLNVLDSPAITIPAAAIATAEAATSVPAITAVTTAAVSAKAAAVSSVAAAAVSSVASAVPDESPRGGEDPA
jgi:hypothetical protein